MAIDLTKQRLYSVRLVVPDDNRYPYGAFNAYYSNQVFYASIREDLTDDVIYNYLYYNETSELVELGIPTSKMSWFVAYFYYDENRLLNTELSFMELMTDITDYSKQLSDLPTIPDGYTLKWNIHVIAPHLTDRDNNGSYLKDDYVIGSTDEITYYVWKALINEPVELSETYWSKIYNITENELYNEFLMEDFVYDMLSNPKCQVVGDFIEGDRIVELEEDDSDLASISFEKYGCNKYRVDLSNIIITEDSLPINGDVIPISNTTISIVPFSDYGTSNEKDFIFMTNIDEGGYYNFTVDDDGIYIATIINDDNIIYQDYLFITCSVENCVAKLLDLIYCNDLDCCKSCNEDCTKLMEFRRNELNKLMMFMNIISATLNYQKISYTGLVVLDSDLHNNIQKANEWYSRVQEIIDRCGTCGDNVSSNSGGCTQC